MLRALGLATAAIAIYQADALGAWVVAALCLVGFFLVIVSLGR